MIDDINLVQVDFQGSEDSLSSVESTAAHNRVRIRIYSYTLRKNRIAGKDL